MQFGITIKGSQHLIGDLHVEIMAPHTFSIGYTLDDVFWNNGFGTEAVLGLLSYMHEEHGFFKCIAYIYKQNEKSRHLLKKIGFKKFDESFSMEMKDIFLTSVTYKIYILCYNNRYEVEL